MQWAVRVLTESCSTLNNHLGQVSAMPSIRVVRPGFRDAQYQGKKTTALTFIRPNEVKQAFRAFCQGFH